MSRFIATRTIVGRATLECASDSPSLSRARPSDRRNAGTLHTVLFRACIVLC